MTGIETRLAVPEGGSTTAPERETTAPRRETSTQTRVSSPLVATSVPMRARVSEIADAVGRPTTGRPAVRKTTSAPLVVPAELLATSRAWYSVPAASPATDTDTATPPRPDPAFLTTVEVPYDVVFPSSNHQFVECPNGSTVPVRTTVAPETCAGPVVTRGPSVVANERVSPFVLPASLRATTR